MVLHMYVQLHLLGNMVHHSAPFSAVSDRRSRKESAHQTGQFLNRRLKSAPVLLFSAFSCTTTMAPYARSLVFVALLLAAGAHARKDKLTTKNGAADNVICFVASANAGKEVPPLPKTIKANGQFAMCVCTKQTTLLNCLDTFPHLLTGRSTPLWTWQSSCRSPRRSTSCS